MFYIREVRQKYLYYIYKKKEEMAIMYNNVSASWKKKLNKIYSQETKHNAWNKLKI